MDGIMNRIFENTGYWAVILGGSAGMGLAAARQLAESGMNLCIVHRDGRVQMKEVAPVFDALRAQGIELLHFNIDASNSEKMYAAIEELKSAMGSGQRVRLLLHAVARGNLKPLVSPAGDSTLNSDDFQLTIDAMALNWYRWTMALHQQQLFAEDARLLALTSEGSQRAWRGYGAVAAAKATLEALMRSMALEFAPYGMRCNVLQPGVTDTASLRMIPGHDDMIAGAIRRNPFNRLTTPEEVARVVLLMCKDESAWINGAIIPVDGGERISG